MNQRGTLPEHSFHLAVKCLKDAIDTALRTQFRVGSVTLRQIFDCNANLYKQNNLDTNQRYPLGPNRLIDFMEPEVGQDVDVVKPYITSTGYCAWTRGTLIGKEAKKYTVKYDNTETPSTVHSQPFFDVRGSRTPDHEWRMALETG